MGGQLGRIPSIPGYLVFRTLCVVHLHVRYALARDRAMVLLYIPGSPVATKSECALVATHDIPV